jgi:uncharacterized protein
VSNWRTNKQAVANALAALETRGFVTSAGGGTTQSDGFDDCADRFHRSGQPVEELTGFCFFTAQDKKRAKAGGRLPLAFWGAPDGSPEAMLRAAGEVVAVFEGAGFTVDWSGDAGARIEVLLG